MSMGANKFEPYAARRMQNGLAPDIMRNIARLGMSPRQQELNRMWAAYRGQQYAARRVDWDGRERTEGIDAEAIATAGFLPPGFYDAGSTFPIKYRRPATPYHLRKVIPDRFTGLLFSERRHPSLRVEGDAQSEDYIRALADVARLWPAMIQARTYGGAMGTVAVGFQFTKGKPVVEVHDPRWCIPTFKDRFTLKLEKIEKRYQFPVDEQNPETGAWEQVAYWYRRVIDEEKDVLYKPLKVEDEEPRWEPAEEVEHGLGFCPVLWVQNLPVQDDIDGDPDVMGIEDLCEQIDALLSQASKGVLANCDPTLRIITDYDLSQISKGSDNALKLPAGSSADYMEMTGTGPKAALDLADKLRTLALEVAQCVLDHPDTAQRTATEVERAYSSMLSKADILREQYGQKCILPLMEMMVEAVKILNQPRRTEQGIVRQVVELPPRIDAQEDGTVERAARELGPGGTLMLVWPGYFAPTLADAEMATRAAASANAAGLLDKQHAVAFIAPHFGVENVKDVLSKVKKEADELAAQQNAMMMGGAAPEMPMEDAGYAEEPTEDEAGYDEEMTEAE